MVKKRFWRGERKHIDENLIRVKKEAREKLAFILQHGDENDFVEAIKSWKEDITPEELQEWIMLFHDCRDEKRGL